MPLFVALTGCRERPRAASPEFVEAQSAFEVVVASTGDPSYTDPAFVRVEALFRRVPADAPEHRVAQSIADDLADAQRRRAEAERRGAETNEAERARTDVVQQRAWKTAERLEQEQEALRARQEDKQQQEQEANQERCEAYRARCLAACESLTDSNAEFVSKCPERCAECEAGRYVWKNRERGAR